MQLDNSFYVNLSVADTWALLTDLPRVAPCLPGAHLDDIVDGSYHGGISTKIGPVTAKYKGTAQFTERDDVERRVVITARGREERGSGSASATITAALRPEDNGTQVAVTIDLLISGRAAQFGRSLLTEVSSTMIGEFVHRLEHMIHGESADDLHGTRGIGEPDSSVPGRGEDTAPRPAVSRAHEQTDNSLDMGAAVLMPLLRKAAAPAATALAGGLIGLLLGRRGVRAPSTVYLITRRDLAVSTE